MLLADTPEALAAIGIQPAPQLERDIAALVRAEFSIEARIERARKHHKARRHLIRAQRLAKAGELNAA